MNKLIVEFKLTKKNPDCSVYLKCKILKIKEGHVHEWSWDDIRETFFYYGDVSNMTVNTWMKYIAKEEGKRSPYCWKFKYIPTPAEKRKAYQKKYYKRNKAKLDEYQENYRKEMKELKKDCLKKIKRTINGNR